MAKLKSISIFIFSVISISIVLNGCSQSKASKSPKKITLKLVAYDSFPKEDTGINAAIKSFEKKTNYKVEIINAGDTGTMISKAALTSGKPEGDVLWGVDNTMLDRAIDSEIFMPYRAKYSDEISSEFTSLVQGNYVTPVDYGDVCINYDIDWFQEKKLKVPITLKDLVKPEYKGLLAVQDPSSSSPGLAFLLSTIKTFGSDGFENYWKELRKNDVDVSTSWDVAYYEKFSGSTGKGNFPMVVSYATSPAAEVIYADPPINEAPTRSISESCFRQTEFTGILRGTKHARQAKELIDFLISEEFQKEIPLGLFVYPVRSGIEVPEVFDIYAIDVDEELKLSPEEIADNSKSWIDKWNKIVLR